MKLLSGIISLALLLAGMPVATLRAQSSNVSTTSEVTNRQYDLVVIGGTPSGIACAVRAARQGLRVLLVNHSQHLGGFSSSGLGAMDTQYDGARAPILDEWARRALDYYRARYGENSPQYKTADWGPREISRDRFTYEPHVAEKIYSDLVAGEKAITLLKGYYPVAVERAERIIQAALLMPVAGGERLRVTGRIFVDAMYEGDLAALAGVPYHVGRESREEYGEPHAGRIFVATGFTGAPGEKGFSPYLKGAYPHEAVTGELNLRPFEAVSQQVFAGSTGEGDHKVQAYQLRLTLTRDPNNRRYPEKPRNYDPSFYAKWIGSNYPSVSGNDIPNQKINWNRGANVSGGSDEYPTADWPKRQEIFARHRDFALGTLYFLQNDPSVPEQVRQDARQWGLAKDEFTDNDNLPYEMYIREARRIVGRYVFTEHDATLARGHRRAPIHADSVAIAEWFMDSHEVSAEKQPGSSMEGKIILSELTRPSQIPYRSLLPQELDNLLVTVCLSTTHVAWGTIRLEPTLMQVGEAAGFAAALALREKTTPGRISTPRLQQELVKHGHMLSFFNDVDLRAQSPWVEAIQYLGTKGFFDSYNARPGKPLVPSIAREWTRTFGEIAAGIANPNERARSLFQAGAGGDAESVTAAQFAGMLANALAYWGVKGADEVERGIERLSLNRGAAISRGDACRLIYHTLARIREAEPRTAAK